MNGFVDRFGFFQFEKRGSTGRRNEIPGRRCGSTGCWVFRCLSAVLVLLGASAPALAANPVVTGISPASGSAGSAVTISGSGFGATPAANVVTLGGAVNLGGRLLTVVEASPTQLKAVVPPNANTSKIRVAVAGFWGESSGAFIVAPVINNLSPGRAVQGATVQIRGKNFSPSTAGNQVTFNGIPAVVTAANTVQLTTTVPAGASTGQVKVVNGGLSGVSTWPFDVISTAVGIDGFSPGTGIIGTVVTLKGKYFSSTISANQISLNGVPATITDATTTSLTFVVPIGASSGPISITVAGQTVTTVNDFQVAQTGSTLVADGSALMASTVTAGQYFDLSFTAVAGDDLGLGVTAVIQNPVSSSKKPYVSILKPDNTVFRTAICADFCVLELSAVPVSGTYTVRVFPNNASSTLSALVALTRTVTTMITPAEPIDIHLDRVGRISKVQFSGVAGQFKSLELSSSTDVRFGKSDRIEVRRSNGSLLYYENAAVSCLGCSSLTLLNLPDTDLYTLVVTRVDDWSEELNIRVVEPTPVLVDGPSLAGEVVYPYRTGLLTFSGIAGQRLDFGLIVPITTDYVSNSYSANRVRFSVFGPLGNLVSQFSPCESLTGAVYLSSYDEAGCAVAIKTVPVTGDYKVLISYIGYFETVFPIHFVATVSTPNSIDASIDGPALSLNLNRPGQAGLINFDGTVGQDLQFNGGPDYNGMIYFPLTAYKPDGSELMHFPAANSAGSIDFLTLPVTGTYVLEEGGQTSRIFDRPMTIPVTIKSLQSCSARAQAIPTTISLSSVSPNPVVLDSSFTVSANVTPSNGVCGVAHGTVAVTIQGSGIACSYSVPTESECALNAVSYGSQALSMAYTPTDPTMFSASSLNVSNAVTVLRKPVGVTITEISPEPTESGQPVTIVVQVVPVPSATPAPTGVVYVNDDSGRSCSFNLPSTSCTLNITTVGVRSLTATYNGNTIYLPGNSSAVPHTVTPGPPTILQFSPMSGVAGSSVTITGTNFDPVIGNDAVAFNGTSAFISYASATRLDVVVPNGATTGPIQVTVGGRSVQSDFNFTVTTPPPPVITSFSPLNGIYGESVEIYGSNFNATLSNNSVTFNGTPATLTSATTTKLVATVPTGSSTGPIQVTVLGRSATSATNFVVTSPLPAPIVSGFSPMSGVAGTPVTISGFGFNANIISGNFVTFNGVLAFVVQASATQLVALVPQGATTGPISVAVVGQIGISASSFDVIPNGAEVADVAIVSVNAEPSIAGQSFTIQVAVSSASPKGPTPTGAVTVSDGVNGCLITLPATTCSMMQSEVGETQLYAKYTGNEIYATTFSPFFPHITNPTTSTEICGFDPRTVPNDPPGFVPIGQLSGAVYTAGQAQNIVGDGSLSVTIDSPVDGATVRSGIVDVVGTFIGPVNTGITINGISAKTVNGRFMVPNVMLAAGTNTLEAIATTLPGLTATASITVSRTGAKSTVSIDAKGGPMKGHPCLACVPLDSPVSFHAESPIGMAPASIAFSLEFDDSLPGNDLQSIRIDPYGDGTDYVFATLDDFPTAFSYSKPGLFNALVEVTTGGGRVYTATQWVLIRSMAVERGALCDVYGYLKAKLTLADAPGASLAYASAVRPGYFSGFAQIGAELPLLAPELGTIVGGFAGPSYAEILVMRDGTDQARSGFHVHMVQDVDGVWRISGM